MLCLVSYSTAQYYGYSAVAVEHNRSFIDRN